MSASIIELDPEEKQKRIDRLMEHTKKEIATHWITLGYDMKDKYDKLKVEFIEYKIANDISRFFEDIRLQESDEILGRKIRSTIQGNILYIDWPKKQEAKYKKISKEKSLAEKS
jgi:hypothetical protein